MDTAVVARLLALNRTFYAAFAHAFAASRPASDPALRVILPHIPAGASVLDVGCGNGRLALLLDRERPGASYVGVDASPELVELARAQAGALGIDAGFHVADVARPGWDGPLAGARYDRVVALAVLHHLPGFDLRLRLVRRTAGLLAPGGRLVLSTWQFLDSPRTRRKVVDWAETGLEEAALEPGDYLLDWERGGRGLRYCHLVDEAELGRLADGAGLRVCETFRAGGKEGNLSLYAVCDVREND